ncbi:AAA family ATPase [Herbaspirillum huttiense F1]|uniref:AAA family ATPase n=1 Tax=Herbaspirillum huttiense TaxID=863372 RepID=UPI00288712E0|nr:AAA family ATPase [Herbaspirillum huttiense]MDT0357831.1 AAA family ATPase [Herbaspirillum huttiense F1]
MKILRFEVSGLQGKDVIQAEQLHSDLNILTGRNGAGKTSLMKLMWYIISGNILLAINEVNFKRVVLETDLYEITVHRISKNTCKIELVQDGNKTFYEDIHHEEEGFFTNAEDEPNEILRAIGSSVFLPTFRRIEGGFSLNGPNYSQNKLARAARGEVEDALATLSKKLSNGPHVFVSSISTVDVAGLLLRKHSELTDQFALKQQSTSQEIISAIKNFKSDQNETSAPVDANAILDGIREKVEGMDQFREQVMLPVEAVRELVMKLFKHSGIKIGRLDFGEAVNAVNSDSLSAGEKQMLSFICYNAFYKDSVFFIDEPELSLHVDWQRQLFPILQAQQTSNQFIIATHSPFIYSKYPDKEIIVKSDRGDSEIGVQE